MALDKRISFKCMDWGEIVRVWDGNKLQLERKPNLKWKYSKERGR